MNTSTLIDLLPFYILKVHFIKTKDIKCISEWKLIDCFTNKTLTSQRNRMLIFHPALFSSYFLPAILWKHTIEKLFCKIIFSTYKYWCFHTVFWTCHWHLWKKIFLSRGFAYCTPRNRRGKTMLELHSYRIKTLNRLITLPWHTTTGGKKLKNYTSDVKSNINSNGSWRFFFFFFYTFTNILRIKHPIYMHSYASH